MAEMKTTANELIEAIKEAEGKKTTGYDTAAEVRRITDGTAWVHIPGGVDETPVALTISAEVGDTVQVRVSGGSAWITGNKSKPPTDDAVAKIARTTATEAQATAQQAEETANSVAGIAEAAQASAATAANAAAQAVEDAGRAQTAADTANNILTGMQNAATAAGTTLNGIYADAETAKTNAQTAITNAGLAQTAASEAKAQAENAGEYAARALGNLSTVQSVAETLAWITQHGTMTLTSDVALDPTHVYFVIDAGGDYTVGGTTYAIVTEPDVNDIGTYYELSIDESLNNYVGTHLALDGEGLWLLPAASGTNKVLIATGAGSTYTEAGTYIVASNGDVIGKFATSGCIIGKNEQEQSRAIIDPDGWEIISNVPDPLDPDSYYDLTLAHIGYDDISQGTNGNVYYTLGTRKLNNSGVYGQLPPVYDPTDTYQWGDMCRHDGTVFVCTYNITTPEPWTIGHWHYYIGNESFAEGGFVVSAGYGSHAEGAETYSMGYASHSEGDRTQSRGNASHSEGDATKAIGDASHSEGTGTKATGYASHAEGGYTEASRSFAHSEGGATVASAAYSHAEGRNTTASAENSHAEGYGSVASGFVSHAQNLYTKASSDYQTALGKYNIEDNADTYAVIVGNGTADNARSNALTVDWNGKIECGNASGTLKSIFDIFYPVGSYYETSDTSFNPNIEWGGTWQLETEGQVHISGSTNGTYQVTGAPTDTTDGGSKDAIVVAHDHSVNITSGSGTSHSHGAGTLKGSTPSLTSSGSNFMTSASAVGSYQATVTSSSSASYNYVRVAHSGANIGKGSVSISAGSNNVSMTGSTGSESAHTHSVSGDTGSSGGSGTGANMQPYIIVNRWHRTA